jgi:hypothetical protein
MRSVPAAGTRQWACRAGMRAPIPARYHGSSQASPSHSDPCAPLPAHFSLMATYMPLLIGIEDQRGTRKSIREFSCAAHPLGQREDIRCLLGHSGLTWKYCMKIEEGSCWDGGIQPTCGFFSSSWCGCCSSKRYGSLQVIPNLLTAAGSQEYKAQTQQACHQGQ